MSEQQATGATALTPITNMEGSLGQRVYRSLRDAIIDARLEPGLVLRKAEICEILGVSRSPVAEAYTKLAAEGLLDVVPQSATRVSYLSIDEIHEGAFIRLALELAVVEKVAADISDKQATELKRNLRLQQLLIEDEDFFGFHDADVEMHDMLFRFSGYPRVAHLNAQVSSQVMRARLLLVPTGGRARESFAEHTDIVNAVANHEPQRAREAMRTHLDQLLTRLQPLVDKRPELFGQKK